MKCKNCGKKLCRNSYARCKSCAMKYNWQIGKYSKRNFKGVNNPNFDNHKLKGKNNPNYANRYSKKNKLEIHHIDLNHYNNRKNNMMKLTSSKHTSLHSRAYDYLVKIGKIRQYIKWFLRQNFKNYSLAGQMVNLKIKGV
jgi:hypothetical protein